MKYFPENGFVIRGLFGSTLIVGKRKAATYTLIYSVEKALRWIDRGSLSIILRLYY